MYSKAGLPKAQRAGQLGAGSHSPDTPEPDSKARIYKAEY